MRILLLVALLGLMTSPARSGDVTLNKHDLSALTDAFMRCAAYFNAISEVTTYKARTDNKTAARKLLARAKYVSSEDPLVDVEYETWTGYWREVMQNNMILAGSQDGWYGDDYGAMKIASFACHNMKFGIEFTEEGY